MSWRQAQDPIRILYEDETLVAFDKPSGLLTAPDRWSGERENLMGLVHARCSPDWVNAFRLDTGASGVLLCAKDRETLRALVRLFASGGVAKRYVAITRGAPVESEGTIAAPLAPDQRQPGRMRISEAGRKARTRYRLLERWRRYASLELTPATERTHQLRAHLASIGCPIVLDTFYGDGRPLRLSEIKSDYKESARRPETPLMARLALHAASVTLAHPATGATVTIEAPLPKDFRVSLRYLERFGG